MVGTPEGLTDVTGLLPSAMLLLRLLLLSMIASPQSDAVSVNRIVNEATAHALLPHCSLSVLPAMPSLPLSLCVTVLPVLPVPRKDTEEGGAEEEDRGTCNGETTEEGEGEEAERDGRDSTEEEEEEDEEDEEEGSRRKGSCRAGCGAGRRILTAYMCEN